MRQRRSYPKPFKSQVVQECLQPEASVSSVAISHGINANAIHKWLPIYRDKAVAPLPAFVPLTPCPRGMLMRRWLSHYRWALKPSATNGLSPTRRAVPALSAAFCNDPH